MRGTVPHHELAILGMFINNQDVEAQPTDTSNEGPNPLRSQTISVSIDANCACGQFQWKHDL
jgi:hypothetical protein